MTDPKVRFSSRVENYKKYRPGYPKKIIKYLNKNFNLTSEKILADIGSGTGIFTLLLLDNHNIVYAVEPNIEMREEAENSLKNYKNFFSINGSAERTNLKNNSVDFIFAAQAFHWFNPYETKKEFNRILKKDGLVILIWNSRLNEATPFMEAYEKFLIDNSVDYKNVDHAKISDDILYNFFKEFKKVYFRNFQTFNFTGLKGRVLSSSYIPSEENPMYKNMIKNLEKLYQEFNTNDNVEFIYNTEVYIGKL